MNNSRRLDKFYRDIENKNYDLLMSVRYESHGGGITALLKKDRNGIANVTFKNKYTDQIENIPVTVKGLGNTKTIRKVTRAVTMALNYSDPRRKMGLDLIMTQKRADHKKRKRSRTPKSKWNQPQRNETSFYHW